MRQRQRQLVRVTNSPGNQPATMHIYQLQEFLIYPNFAYKLAMLLPYKCNANDGSGGGVGMQQRWHWWQRLWFAFGAICLIYQNFGLLIALLLNAPQLPGWQKDMAGQQQQQIVDTAQLIGQISEAGSIMGLTIVGSCKMWCLLRHGKRIAQLLHNFERIFPTERTQSTVTVVYGRLSHFAQSSQWLMGRTTLFFIFAFCYYNAFPLVVSLYELLMDGQLTEYHYQSNTWYPWHTTRVNSSTWSFYAAAIASYACQMQSSLTGVAFIMAGELLVCFCTTQMRLHYDLLAHALDELDANAPHANEQLKQLIDYHNQLLSLTQEINRIFNMSFFVNFATSAIAICLMGFSMLMSSLVNVIKYSVGLLSFLVLSVFLCYNGTQFTEASQQIFPAAFHHNWYDGNIGYRKMLLFFMLRAKDANTLRAYQFYTVSMQTFMAILKFSYQLFTFFRAMS